MIDVETKEKLLDEIRKHGNIYFACLKVGISRADYYRWIKKDKKFREKAEEALRIGKENFVDICEGSLMKNVKNGNQKAIEYALRFNSERYNVEKQNVRINALKEQQNKRIELDEHRAELRKLLEIATNSYYNRVTTDTADSKSLTDKRLKDLQENQKPSNSSNLNSATPDKTQDNNI